MVVRLHGYEQNVGNILELIAAGTPPYLKNYPNILKYDFAKIFINTF